MKSKYLLIILLLLSLLAPIMPHRTTAQTPTDPIILWMDGDYFRYTPSTESMVQLTTWGYNRLPVISPDNTRIAYSSTATVAVEAIQQVGGIGGGDLPSNIWIIEIESGDGFRIADQPPDASMFADGVPDKFILRSTPAWSPDNTKLAWTELLFPQDTNRLAIYTFATGTTDFIDIPASPFGVPAASQIRWGDSGIVVEIISTETQGVQNDFYVYDSDGSFRIVLTAPSLPENVFYGDFEMVDFGVSEFLGLWRSDGSWTLLDPNGVQPVQSYQGPIEVYNPLSPNSIVGRVALGDGSYSSVIVTPSQSFQLGENSAGYNSFTIAPDGNAIAYIDVPTNTPYYWQNGTLNQIPIQNSISSLVWGYTEFRVPGTATLASSVTEPTVCQGFMVSRLSTGFSAVVLPGAANNVRANPGLDEALAGSIPGGAEFDVIGGPTCAGGSAWWRVTYGDITGWTAEGSGTEYWLRPGTQNSIAPNLPGAVLEVTQAGSPLTAFAGVSRASDELDDLLWGDRVLWTGNRINNETLPWLEVTLGSGATAYVVETSGALTVRNPGYQTPGLDVGDTIRITQAGDRMNLRTDTSTYSELIRALLAGDTMTVIGGPVYSEYYIWWQLRLPTGETGWAVDVPGWFQVQ